MDVVEIKPLRGLKSGFRPTEYHFRVDFDKRFFCFGAARAMLEQILTGDCRTIRIRMLKTVVPDFPFYLTGVKDGTHLLRDGIYSATSNGLGAVSGFCHNGQQLGVKPGEFEFVEAPEWLLSIHRKREPFFRMNGMQILTGDCRTILPTIATESVQCCVTSPPYWGLRDYGTASWEGGSPECDHIDEAYEGSRISNSPKQLTSRGSYEIQFKSECAKCGARRIDAQLGLESTPEEYIAHMVAVFREVWRVLRDDGTLWLNMGDSYCSTAPGTMDHEHIITGSGAQARKRIRPDTPLGLKPKDLCMMPARLAMALQADGWYLRSEIVWHKPNPMPESVTDRPTKAHEMIYLLAKQERYYYDNDAIREPATESRRQSTFRGGSYCDHSSFNNSDKGITKTPLHSFNLEPRNKRSVWTIATQPYAEAHFATFPEEIPKLCILAGSKLGDTVLDPFAGSGTVGQVALELGRKAILIELNPAYIELARARTFTTPGFL